MKYVRIDEGMTASAFTISTRSYSTVPIRCGARGGCGGVRAARIVR